MGAIMRGERRQRLKEAFSVLAFASGLLVATVWYAIRRGFDTSEDRE